MSEMKLTAERRTAFGKGAARRIRRDHKIPAVLYGHGTAPVHITLPGHDTMMALKAANALLSIELDGESQLALAKDVQRDPIKPIIEHVDLVLVRRGEKVTVDVPVRTEGEASPDTIVTLDSQTLQLLVDATRIPESITVSVEALPAGHPDPRVGRRAAGGLRAGVRPRDPRRQRDGDDLRRGPRGRAGRGCSRRRGRTRSRSLLGGARYHRDPRPGHGRVVPARHVGVARRRAGQPRAQVCRYSPQSRRSCGLRAGSPVCRWAWRKAHDRAARHHDEHRAPSRPPDARPRGPGSPGHADRGCHWPCRGACRADGIHERVRWTGEGAAALLRSGPRSSRRRPRRDGHPRRATSDSSRAVARAGHNGLRSVTAALGTRDYLRVRVGIGRPPGRMDPTDFLLHDFSRGERGRLPVVVSDAADATVDLVTLGLVATQQRYHRTTPEKGDKAT